MTDATPLPHDSTAPLYIDVRSAGEYRGGWLEGALNLPLEQLQQRIAEVAPDLSRTLVLYCASGGRSAHGCAVLKQLGYTQVHNGGGLGALSLSLQRPVRRL